MMYWVQHTDESGEIHTIGEEPFSAESPEAAIAEYMRQSGRESSEGLTATKDDIFMRMAFPKARPAWDGDMRTEAERLKAEKYTDWTY